MNAEKNSLFRSLCVIISIIIGTTSVVILDIGLNNHQTASAQQLSNLSSADNQTLSEGISFQIENVTFSHHTTPVNGIQMHYVIGGHGDPVVLLHGWPETWYQWRHVMPILAKNYTVIAPDLRGLGDSSKPPTGYDGKNVAEDIYQLVTNLGFKSIFLVGHDIGVLIAYPYAAEHPTEVKALAVMEAPIPGFYPPNRPMLWWIPFHQTPNVPEALVQGKEMTYLSWFYQNLAYNPTAITQDAINEYVSHYSAPGGMRAGFEYYRAIPQDESQNVNYSKTKLTIPVLALGGGNTPAFGGNVTKTSVAYGLNMVAQDVSEIIIPNSGHWIPEEQPQFLADSLIRFFGNSTQ